MASPQVAAEYVQDRLQVIADLEEDGHRLSFGVLNQPTEDYRSAGPYQEVGTSVVFPLSHDVNFSDDVRADDKFYLVSAELDIESCSHMRDGDKELCIYKVKPFDPDNVTQIFYEIQVRA